VTDGPSSGWRRRADRLAGESIAAGDPTGWFERLYAAGLRGEVDMPWDREQPDRRLTDWTRGRDGAGRRALVVGCGLGADAEHVAGLGFDTDAFDVAESAIRTARARHPRSAVRYRQADLLTPPAEWCGVFDLVVESYTVQAMPDTFRTRAIAGVTGMVGPGGTLLVIASAHGHGHGSGGDQRPGPPWPLTEAEINSFAVGDLVTVRVGRDDADLRWPRWVAEFRRP
jgi:SAM-dependent methyltransferase